MVSEFFAYELAIVLLSGIVHGVLGFGFPMISTPLFALFMDLKKAVLYTLFPTIITNIFSLKRENSFSSIWSEYKLLILGVMCGSLMGTGLLIWYNSVYYKLILASVILLYLNKKHLHISLEKPLQHHPKLIFVLMGILSGFVGGIANIMVPVLIVLILELKLDKKRSIGVMNFCFITNKSLQVLLFGFDGNFNTENSMLIALFVLIALCGFMIGAKLQDKIDEQLYKKLLNIVLWLLSLYLIFATFYM